MELFALREAFEAVRARLSNTSRWPELRAAYLDLAPLTGQLQGVVRETAREMGQMPSVRDAEAALVAMQAALRQVGLDIRLASEPALNVGLQTVIERALAVLDALERQQ